MYFKVVNEFYCSILAKGIYKLKYFENTIVNAPPGSLGIMVFGNLKCALDYIEGCGLCMTRRILEVEGIGEISYPSDVCRFPGDPSALEIFYDKRVYLDFIIRPPRGTICFPSVKVITEIELEES